MRPQNIKILLVEDNPDHAFLARRSLEKEGAVAIEVVQSYEKCCQALRRQHFDVILLDYELPQEDGLTILKRLVNDKNIQAPIVVVTGHGHEKIAVEAMKAGAFDYVVKSDEYPALLPELVHRVLDRYRVYREKKKIDEELRVTKFHLENLINSSLDLIISVKNTGEFRFFNDRFVEIIGYSSEEIFQKRILDIFPEQHRTLLKNKIREVKRGLSSIFETEIQKSDMSLLPCLVSQSPLKGQDGFLMVIKDISKIVSLKKRLAQSEKLSALGQMISGVAHELNNPLAGILGYSQLILLEALSDQMRSDMEVIVKEAKRCQKIVKNLLTFARKHSPEQELFDINEVLGSVLELRAYQLQVDSIEVVKELGKSLPYIRGDFQQLQQVFLNLINNAHYALKQSSKETKQIVLRSKRQGSSIKVQVVDNGVGIDSKTQNRIFDPFFTTKEIGQGTGLGLSICYGIIQNHQGNLYVESKPGVGSTFVVELPAIEAESLPKDAKESQPSVHKRTQKMAAIRCLVIDDEKVIIDLVKRILGREGHTVETARNGEQALRKIEQSHFDLLICDVKMPQMNGESLYHLLKQQAPDLAEKTIFTTGDMINHETMDFLHQTPHPFLQKPFHAEELLTLVRNFCQESRV
ncbi:MAG: response regulator [bacterium]